MTCNELVDKLLEDLDGELVEDQKTRAEVHLTGCDNCKFYLESYTHTVKVTRLLPKCGPLPDGLAAKLRAVVEEHLKGTAPADGTGRS